MNVRACTWAAVLGVTTLGACRCDSFRFYDVVRDRVEECDILPQGELCDEPEGFAPPVTEVWAVEHAGDEIRVYVDEEVWIAEPQNPEDNPSFVTANKVEVSAREPGPCTTTRTRSFEILATPDPYTGTLTGEIAERSILIGPEACGETPTGLRTRARLDGVPTGAP
ncbi:MAG: hypothetical protein IT383_09865 [Deltaproteobacteria bacterium]|nr:hypothetical protein [Deltaproteobacteria bacterium]